MTARIVGYDYYIGRRKVHTGITRYPSARLLAHNRATGQRGRIRIRTPRMSNSQARAWKRRQAARGAPTLGYLNKTPNSAAIWVEAHQEARSVAMNKGLPEAMVRHCAQQVADEVFHRHMRRLEDGEIS